MTKILFRVGIFGALMWLAIFICGAIGWVKNIIHMIAHISDPLTGLEILRIAGIFIPPLGAVLGWVC